MNSWKVIPTIVFATVLIFSAGVFTGGMLVDHLRHIHQQEAAKRAAAAAAAVPCPTNSAAATNVAVAVVRPVKPPEVLSKDFLQRLDGEIQLTKDEHDAIQKIITEGQNSMRKVVQDARLEIRDALSDEHRNQFDELMKRPFRKPLFNTNAPPGTVLSTNTP